MTRTVVRRSHTQLGEFMLPALATIAAPYAVAEWEFVERRAPVDEVDPVTATHGYHCLGCGELFWCRAPLEVNAYPICDECKDEYAPEPGAARG